MFFKKMIFRKKRSPGMRSHNEVVFLRDWEFSQQAMEARGQKWGAG